MAEFILAIPRWTVSLAIAAHFCGVSVLAMPDSDLRRRLEPWVPPHLYYFGFWQDWAMYAPDPPHHNVDLAATVHYRDGHVAEYRLTTLNPRTGMPALWDTPLRKLILALPSSYWAWPDVALYVARQANSREAPPREVNLTLVRVPIPAPAAPPTGNSSGAATPEGKRVELGTWPINPVLLEGGVRGR